MLYDVPGRTGRKIATRPSCAWLARCRTSWPSRTPAADPAATARLLAEAPEGFEVYSGDDPLTLSLLAVGAVGVIGVATHWSAPVMAEMIAASPRVTSPRPAESMPG